MTPSDEAERLARELNDEFIVNFSRDACCELVYDSEEALKIITPILAPLCEENARLREAAKAAEKWISYHLATDKRGLYPPNEDAFSMRLKLRAALQPKPEKTNES